MLEKYRINQKDHTEAGGRRQRREEVDREEGLASTGLGVCKGRSQLGGQARFLSWFRRLDERWEDGMRTRCTRIGWEMMFEMWVMGGWGA